MAFAAPRRLKSFAPVAAPRSVALSVAGALPAACQTGREQHGGVANRAPVPGIRRLGP